VELAASTLVSPAAHVSVKALEQRGVLADLRSGQCWELNEVAFYIWLLLADGASIGKASEAISARYSIAADVSHGDVVAFVRSLAGQGLVVVRTPEDGTTSSVP
jgi:hypothetical protein